MNAEKIETKYASQIKESINKILSKFIFTGMRSIENVKVGLDDKNGINLAEVKCPYCDSWKSISIDKGRQKPKPLYYNFIRHVKRVHCVSQIQIVGMEEIEMVSIY